MSHIGAFEAKTHLPQLLRRVIAGERFVITRHGSPVAELIPFRPADTDKVRAAIDDLKAFQATHSLGGLSIRDMIEEGRNR
ncbi:MAG: type II toxin-antitoxin system prevent-host-death family antitoxin [Gemmatimonadetes bacterium]|nr:type II toxin-antitoxin system prevent-host-death family antitoxin [Gemmatimonadota bacterium]MYA64167.1 type II toxin-antitoxin system prevent-host-death family antitoxin [Gemmatimonadota bacterium]MYB98543.1 type II toxin-antitoxin system prevent-host-death family antitoxin [Gemmatimonadota bacterium]MYH54222.1 type II toxin-antitoxin system prevent-host-death family antitoxin [Gemmatimonadota bacterium]MYI44846.1 type II toxin-antitoxin system prevent-host-death family antitoxin [Gemmatim